MLRATHRRWFSIAGSVLSHRRHLILLEPSLSAEAWPKKIEQTDHILATYSAITDKINTKERAQLVVSVAHPGATNADATPDAATHDALVFPENIRLRNIRAEDVTFVTETLLQEDVDMDALQARVTVAPLQGKHVFVCAHANRDFRCACAGPKLIEWIEKDIPEWQAYATSHYGGHRFAGNCIVHPNGEWYGHVNSRDALDQVHRGIKDDSPVVADLWRGRLGLSKADQLAVYAAEHPSS
ncbi:hypothetical protein SDRG_12718 [Saprolegnia diclina VS20]|uniref:Sucrase/ferredoxin-like-domain-containing protein n=1 Tax=Saprolegnia diclina (strain VS20) TaxID=1156394 RepID=T0Q7Q0_SAPDV|nr:hypothetical protein SDRG_12718 [Saprolegnia diclina VS20]EQC29470.1 hypothetical protein SDRG_12718 [Saprolegnia diclina VS20]|eukprot:XP_008617022.1 hypothetical protein SDRG_12718 [Saprolegnia diclina VS20]